MAQEGSVGFGQQWPHDSGSDLNNVAFVVRQMVARMATMRLVQVKAVHGNGETAAPGTVDVLPLVNQIDGSGNATPHGTVYGIPWWRLQGIGAVICDPKVDDIGFVVVSDRDISNVKAQKKQSNPGSYRKFDLADGVYVGGCLNATPTKYILFAENRIEVHAADKVSLVVGSYSVVVDTTGIHLNGPLFINGIASGPTSGATVDFGSSILKTTGQAQVGSVLSTGDVVGAGKSLDTHIHGGVLVGGANTGPPV